MGSHVFSTRKVIGIYALAFLVSAFCAAFCTTASGATAAVPQHLAATSGSSQRVFLVFPFENAGAGARLDWLGEGLEELTILRLSAAGEQVYSHAGRISELEHAGLPAGAKFSRATMLHLAEDLDADFVVFGSFHADGGSLAVEAHILRVNPTALLPAVRENGALDTLMDLHARVLWRALAANDHAYRLSLPEFVKAQRTLRLDAFEHYIRGILAGEDDARLRELREAVRLEPEWPDPAFSLGETYFARRDCNSALPWFAHVPKTHERYVEAVFSSGVCRLQLNQPDRAEEIFAGLLDMLKQASRNDRGRFSTVSGADVPEILNNLGLARARQGKVAAALADLRRAADLDPDEDDYPFNLGLLALRGNDAAGAAEYFRDAAEREPDNPEDRAFLIQSLEKAGKKPEADQEREGATETFGPSGLPAVHIDVKGDALLRADRIANELDSTALRFEMASPENKTAALPSPEDSLGAHIRRGRQALAAGNTSSAENEFRAALVIDSGSAGAHRGLAEILRRQGKLDEAVKELQASLKNRDSAAARTAMARIYLEQKKPELAKSEAERALKLAPNYAEAKQLLERLQNPNATNGKPPGGAQ